MTDMLSEDYASAGGEWKPSLKIKLALAFGSIILAFLALEVAIRTYDSLQQGRGFFDNVRNPLIHVRGQSLPFREFGFDMYQVVDGVKYIVSRHDELYPLEKPAGAFRIVAFGGSTTENSKSMAAAGIHYPKVLQEKLNARLNRDDIEVINIGFAAYSTSHALILSALDVSSWDPDLLILSHNVNDRSVQYWPDFQFDYSSKYSDPFYTRSGQTDLFTPWNIMFQWSQLYWYVANTLSDFVSRDVLTVKRREYGNEPDAVALEIYKRNLRSFAALAESYGAQVLFASQAYSTDVEFELNERPKSYNRVVTWPLEGESAEHQKIFNDAMEVAALSSESWFIDNYANLDGRPNFFLDQIHYTPEGIEELAQGYADFIVENKIVE